MTDGPVAALLTLADSRLPTGGHAHSGGLETAAAGRVHDLDTLAGFLHGRLATVGRQQAAFAAAACAAAASEISRACVARADELDTGLDARTPSPTQRRTSRAQGRALLRAGRALWPDCPPPTDRHQPVALGLVAAAGAVPPRQAATAAAYATVAGPASAAVRLLGLDPYAVHALLATLAPACDRLAADAAAGADDLVEQLPADGAPLLDLSAEHHATWEVRLFAS